MAQAGPHRSLQVLETEFQGRYFNQLTEERLKSDSFYFSYDKDEGFVRVSWQTCLCMLCGVRTCTQCVAGWCSTRCPEARLGCSPCLLLLSSRVCCCAVSGAGQAAGLDTGRHREGELHSMPYYSYTCGLGMLPEGVGVWSPRDDDACYLAAA